MERKTILIADDQKHMLIVLQRSLAELGCQILAAGSGEEALIQAAETPIDLLLIDFEMSGLTGLQTARHLREMPRYADLPIIMITGRGQNQIRAEATEAGVTFVISKPFSPKRLLETVRGLFATASS